MIYSLKYESAYRLFGPVHGCQTIRLEQIYGNIRIQFPGLYDVAAPSRSRYALGQSGRWTCCGETTSVPFGVFAVSRTGLRQEAAILPPCLVRDALRREAMPRRGPSVF